MEINKMIGMSKFQTFNQRLLRIHQKNEFSIVAHRGQWGGNIVENSINSAKLTSFFGAEIMEVDFAKTKDNKYIAFHTGNEENLCGVTMDIHDKTFDEIKNLRLKNSLHHPINQHFELVEEIFRVAPADLLFQIDRSFFYLPDVLQFLDKMNEELKQRMIIKCHMKREHLDAFESYPYKFMCMPIFSSKDDLELLEDYPNVNFIGIEVLAESENSWTYGKELTETIHNKYNLLVQLNAIRLNDEISLYAGLDDNLSLLDNPDKGWGKLIEFGADFIQTDWVAALNHYREQRKSEQKI